MEEPCGGLPHYHFKLWCHHGLWGKTIKSRIFLPPRLNKPWPGQAIKSCSNVRKCAVGHLKEMRSFTQYQASNVIHVRPWTGLVYTILAFIHSCDRMVTAWTYRQAIYRLAPQIFHAVGVRLYLRAAPAVNEGLALFHALLAVLMRWDGNKNSPGRTLGWWNVFCLDEKILMASLCGRQD